MIDILLVDDQALLCEVLKNWLEVEKDINVLGIAHNGKEAIAKVEELQPQLVLMDIDMPQMNGLQATKVLSQRFPKVKVIILSGHDDDVYLGKSLRAGAKGYLLKNTTPEELVKKIRSVHNNVKLLESLRQDESLIPIQVKLEELVDTYRLKLDDLIAEHNARNWGEEDGENPNLQQLGERIVELESKINDAGDITVSQLEEKNQANWKSIRRELINVNSQFNLANRSLNRQFSQQIDTLKQELDAKVSEALDDWSRQRAALQEWAVQRDEMRPDLENYETKNRQELMSVVNPIRASIGDVDRQVKVNQSWLKIAGLLSLLAIALSGYVFISQIRSRDSFPLPTTPLPGRDVDLLE
ncbi:MAG: response regulator transcription factor [Cyanobacteria bacterium J06623_7]